MVLVRFTDHLRKRLACEAREVEAATVMAALHAAFIGQEAIAGYVLDDQGRLRKHVAVFVNGKMARDRVHLSDPVENGAEIHVMQALSGG